MNIPNSTKKSTIWYCRSVERTDHECFRVRKGEADGGKIKQPKGKGWGNLLSHLNICCPNWFDVYTLDGEKEDERQVDIRQHVKVDVVSNSIFQWIDWVVEDNLSFSFVESVKTRRNTTGILKPIGRTTLMRYLDSLAYECEGLLSEQLPQQFGLFFDGWDAGNSTN